MLPSLDEATKSRPLLSSSETVRLTSRFAVGAGFAFIVKLAAVPSVTGDVPAEIVTSGTSSSSRIDTLPEEDTALTV